MILKVFKAYDYRDLVLTALAVVIFLAMILKMLIFPTGLFNFGAPNIYTEGIVSRNGFQNINPLFVDYNEADREISRLVFSGLMKYDPATGAVVEDMGKLTINEDKTEYTFAIRDGLRWQDGNDLTAEDVYFTFHDVILDETFPNEILKTNFSGVLVEQPTESTIKFTLEQPNVFFISNLTTGVLPKHILGNVAPSEILQNDFNKMPVGSGPYMLEEPVEVARGGLMRATLVRNPNYYAAPSEIETVRLIAFPDMETLIEDINSVNGVVKITGEYVQYFEDNERFDLMSYELPQYLGVFMNMESAVLKDNESVRLALQKAVNKEDLIGMFSDKIPVDTPLMQLDQEEWVYQASADEAAGALKDAGFEYGEEDVEKLGFRYDEAGNLLEVDLIALLGEEESVQFEETKTVVDYLQGVWEGVGIKLNVEFLPGEEFRQRVMNRGYDLLLVGQSLGYNLDTYSYWHSSQADPLGQNLSNYKSFQVDSLIEDIRSVFDAERSEDRLNELAEQIKKDIPAIFLYRPVFNYAIDGKVEGISMDGVVFPSDRYTSISGWKFVK